MYEYTCIYIHTHTHIHTIPYHTLHYITLHYITLHCIALHYITLHYVHTYVYVYIYTYTHALYIGSPHGSVKNRLTKISDMFQNHRFYFRMTQYVYIPPSSEFPVSTLATGYFPSNAAASFLFRQRKVR